MIKSEDNNLEITSVCSILYLCNKYPIFSYFTLPGMIYFKHTNIIATDVFHFKIPCLGFLFLPPVSLEIFSAGFSSRISIFPTID